MRSKPDSVDQSERTARLLIMTVQYALMKCYTALKHRDSSVTIPLPPDQHHCSDEAKWRLGGDIGCIETKESRGNWLSQIGRMAVKPACVCVQQHVTCFTL